MFLKQTKFILYISTFLLAACGGSGSESAPTAIETPQSNTPVTADISADLTKVFLGNSAVITWNSSNATSCQASGGWSGDKATSGSETLILSDKGDQVFTINCGDVSANLNIMVTDVDFEGSCVNPHTAAIPQNYLGEYNIPLPEDTFSEGHLKGMGLKDYGVEWIYNGYSNSYNYDDDESAAWVLGCTKNRVCSSYVQRNTKAIENPRSNNGNYL
jgi:hypothetical protein